MRNEITVIKTGEIRWQIDTFLWKILTRGSVVFILLAIASVFTKEENSQKTWTNKNFQARAERFQAGFVTSEN